MDLWLWNTLPVCKELEKWQEVELLKTNVCTLYCCRMWKTLPICSISWYGSGLLSGPGKAHHSPKPLKWWLVIYHRSETPTTTTVKFFSLAHLFFFLLSFLTAILGPLHHEFPCKFFLFSPLPAWTVLFDFFSAWHIMGFTVAHWSRSCFHNHAGREANYK